MSEPAPSAGGAQAEGQGAVVAAAAGPGKSALLRAEAIKRLHAGALVLAGDGKAGDAPAPELA
jgi:hypothetical protein